MGKSEIYGLLRVFEAKEIRKFGEFLRSPYFNKGKKIIELFEYIKGFHPMYSDIRLEREAISAGIYPGEEFNDSTIRNLLSDLHKAALEFLAYENFGSSEADKHRFLLREIGRRNLEDEFEKAIENYEKDAEEGLDYRYFLTMQEIEAAKFNFGYINEKISKAEKVSAGLNSLENSGRYLFFYFLTELASHQVSLMIYNRRYETDDSGMTLRKIAAEFSPGKIKTLIPQGDRYYPLLEIYAALIEMYSDMEKEENYFSYKDLLFANFDILSAAEKAMHIHYLTSYCIGKVRENAAGIFSKELFGLYEINLNNAYYKDNKSAYLPHELYRSILMHGLRLKKFDWTAGFITKYSNEVHPHSRQNMLKFGNAYLCYNTGDYTGTLKNLVQIDQDFFIYKFDVKNLTLMVYYELGYLEEALSLIKAYHELLRKNRIINPAMKKRYFSFLKFTEKLIYFRYGEPDSEPGYLRHRIKNHQATAFKPWLLEKFSEIEQGIKKAG